MLEKIESQLGYSFKNQELLKQALTHKSFYHESKVRTPQNHSEIAEDHNEKLEFLGDAVLDLVLSDELMARYPSLDEGGLSKMRASLVNEATLSEIALEFGFDQHLLLGKGEKKTQGHRKPRLLASVFESFVGALYQDAGYDTSKALLSKIFDTRLKKVDLDHHYTQDFKTRLQERIQEIYKKTPEYEVIDEKGPDHEKEFRVQVKVGAQVLATGLGSSKKQAAQIAAQKALEEL